MFNLKLIKKMETKQMNVEFVDLDDLRECCLINGSRLISQDIVPDEDYYKGVNDFLKSFEHVNISKMADAISEKNLKGMDLAMYAFTAGLIVAQNSNDLCMKTLQIVMEKCGGISTKACVESQRVANTVYSPEKAAIVSVIQFGIVCFVAGNMHEIMMKAMMENAFGGLLGKMGGR